MNNEGPRPWRTHLREYAEGFEGDIFFTREALDSVGGQTGQGTQDTRGTTGEPSSRFIRVESTYFRDRHPVYIGNQCGGFMDTFELAEHAFSMAWIWQHEPSDSVKPLIHMMNHLRKAGTRTVSIAGNLYPVDSYECELGIAQAFIDRKGAGHVVYGTETDRLELIPIDSGPPA